MEHAMKETVKNIFIDRGFNDEISNMAADIHMEYRVSINGLLNLLQMTEAASRSKENLQVAYICDGAMCDECSQECHHTTNIAHAANFEHLGDNQWMETDKKEE